MRKSARVEEEARDVAGRARVPTVEKSHCNEADAR